MQNEAKLKDDLFVWYKIKNKNESRNENNTEQIPSP